jgi:cobaltochelatase CobS
MSTSINISSLPAPCLRKASTRTKREGCRKCGSTDIYWAKDDATGKFVVIDANSVTRPLAKGDVVPPGNIHGCNHAPVSEPDPEPEPMYSSPVAGEPAYTPDPEPVQPATDPRLAALDALGDLLAPKQTLDPEQVRAMVKEELAGYVFPTQTVVIRENSEPLTVEGMTHKQLADVIANVAAGEHVMMVGPAGSGKSRIARQVAEALGREFSEVSLTPDMSRTRLEGYYDANGKYVRTVLRERVEFGGVMHLDELDNAHPSIIALINALTSNGHFGFPDGMVAIHPDFVLIGSANTYGRGPDRKYNGRQQLDAATLDRFSVETIEYDAALERSVCLSTGLEPARVNEVLAYVRYVRNNVDKHGLAFVVSPRASLGMCRLLAQGRSWDAAVNARVRKGLSDQDWTKVSTGAPSSV